MSAAQERAITMWVQTASRLRRLPIIGRRRGRGRGQTLVEFALAFPLFFLILLFIIEFALVFNATMAVNFATRNASLMASEAGSNTWADCVILQQVEKDMGPPLDRALIKTVWIFKTDRAGKELTPKVQMAYDRTGSKTCVGPGGSITVPYSASATTPNNTYPATSGTRCDQLAGCLVGSPAAYVPLDSVGVKILYSYRYKTPIGGLLRNMFGSCTGLPNCSTGAFDITWSNVMRMEPIL
jgi:Flp pilus assembly protein TadG